MFANQSSEEEDVTSVNIKEIIKGPLNKRFFISLIYLEN